MNNLFTLKFWFNLRPGPLLPLYNKIFIAFVFVLFVATLLSWAMQSKKKGIYTSFWRRLYTFFLVNAFLGVFLAFLNYELVPFLSSRFWFLAWGFEVIVWLVIIVRFLFGIPQKIKKSKKEAEYKKYIP